MKRNIVLACGIVLSAILATTVRAAEHKAWVPIPEDPVFDKLREKYDLASSFSGAVTEIGGKDKSLKVQATTKVFTPLGQQKCDELAKQKLKLSGSERERRRNRQALADIDASIQKLWDEPDCFEIKKEELKVKTGQDLVVRSSKAPAKKPTPAELKAMVTGPNGVRLAGFASSFDQIEVGQSIQVWLLKKKDMKDEAAAHVIYMLPDAKK